MGEQIRLRDVIRGRTGGRFPLKLGLEFAFIDHQQDQIGSPAIESIGNVDGLLIGGKMDEAFSGKAWRNVFALRLCVRPILFGCDVENHEGSSFIV